MNILLNFNLVAHLDSALQNKIPSFLKVRTVPPSVLLIPEYVYIPICILYITFIHS